MLSPLSADTGNVQFGGDIGSNTPIGNLTVNKATNTTIPGNITTNNSNLTFNTPVTLTGTENTTFDTGNGAININNSLKQTIRNKRNTE